MDILVCVDIGWGIGRNNKILYHIPEDMKQFRETTTDKVVIMGRETLKSLPNGEPLKDRMNIVLTHNTQLQSEYENLIYMHSINEVLEYCKDKEAYCIGGERVYHQLLPYCDKAYVTYVINRTYADRHFCNLVLHEDWEQIYTEPVKKSKSGEYYQNYIFKNKCKKN